LLLEFIRVSWISLELTKCPARLDSCIPRAVFAWTIEVAAQKGMFRPAMQYGRAT
jgi:hypothetical protein